jgi:hypothetical protein
VDRWHGSGIFNGINKGTGMICYGEVTAQFEEIGPILAKAMLDKNLNNRRPDKNRIARYVADMKAGYWCFNGDAIRFDKLGNLIDGQHRLLAIIQVDKSFVFLVIRNVVEESKRTIDTGKSRTGGDVLSMFSNVGTRDSGVLSAAIGLLLTYKKGISVSVGGGNQHLTTNSNIEIFYRENYISLQSSLDFLNEITDHHMMVLSRSESLFLHYIFREINKELADDFIKKIVTGASVEINSNEYLFRSILTKRALKTLKITKSEVIFTCIKAWNRNKKGGVYTSEGNLKFGKDESKTGYPVAI